MEETAEGLALASATRAVIKTRKRELEEDQSPGSDGTANKNRKPANSKPVQTPCRHEVAVPEGYAPPQTLDERHHGTLYDPKYAEKPMAKQYPFTLDTFQATAVACIERNESVLVAAHTSAGKTVVAEYAIAKSLKNKQRVVYTSPLKALSNQKFRELSEEFGSVGLMTGDVTLNEHAQCVVMTTEILRSMIYRGSDVLREVAWVIFDEVHYMQDRERGVVWEEVIISLPSAIRMVFLSATLPNCFQFGEWVASLHSSPCHVVITDYRPTPLVHYGYPMGGSGLYLLADSKSKFKGENFDKMRMGFPRDSAIWKDSEGDNEEGGGEEPNVADVGGQDSDKKAHRPETEKELRKLISVLQERELYPLIVFSFSRRECEAYAQHLAGGDKCKKSKSRRGADGKPTPLSRDIDFNSADEKAAVRSIFHAALQCLDEKDRQLLCIKSMLPMLERGVGVHHSGLLPILKEVVELLFQENLVKCLFATETFAMGLNMPAKTVVFTKLNKWDGQETRALSSGEYIQMSGRAGRRGKDDRGFTMLMVDETLTKQACREMLKGEAARLNSSFKLSYYTLLNLIRSRSLGRKDDMEYVISKSFQQFQHEQAAPQIDKEVSELRELAESMMIPQEEMEKFAASKQAHVELQRDKMAILLKPDSCVHLLRPGRIVRIHAGEKDWGYGVLLSLRWIEGGNRSDPQQYRADVMLCCITSKKAVLPCSVDNDEGSMIVVPVSLLSLSEVSTLRIQIPSNLKEPKAKRSVKSTLKALMAKYPQQQLPHLDPLADFNVSKRDIGRLQSILSDEKTIQNDLQTIEAKYGDDITKKLKRAAELQSIARKKEYEASQSPLKTFKEEFHRRKDVLRKLGHIDESDTVTLKGRAASQIDTGDELLVTELMFDGTFGALDAHELASLLSCMVPVEKSRGCPKLPLRLSNALLRLKQVAGHIFDVSKECNLDMDGMDSMYCWMVCDWF
jgi:ATP-dependent RNA helicase DOB1